MLYFSDSTFISTRFVDKETLIEIAEISHTFQKLMGSTVNKSRHTKMEFTLSVMESENFRKSMKSRWMFKVYNESRYNKSLKVEHGWISKTCNKNSTKWKNAHQSRINVKNGIKVIKQLYFFVSPFNLHLHL